MELEGKQGLGHLLRCQTLVVACLSCVSIHAPVLAQDDHDRTEARALFEHGLNAMKEGRLSDARDHYERALELAANPAIAFNLAVVYRGLGLPVEATELAKRLDEGNFGELAASEKGQVIDFLVAVRAERATIAFAKHCAEDRLLIDGNEVRIEKSGNHLNPGLHSVHATRGEALLVNQSVNFDKRQIYSVAAGPVCQVDQSITPMKETGVKDDDGDASWVWWVVGGAAFVGAVTVVAIVLAGSGSDAQTAPLPDDNRFGIARP